MQKILRTKISTGLAILILAVSTIILVACTNQSAETTKIEPPVKVKVGGHVVMASVVLEVAKDRGFFKEENLEVEIERVSSSKVTMASLENGTLDVALASRSAGTFNHLAKNDKLRIVADVTRAMPVVIVKKDLRNAVIGLKDLKGKIFATPRAGSASEYSMAKLLAGIGLSLADMEVKGLEGQEAVAALEAGNLDAAAVNEPYGTLALEKGIGYRLAEKEIAAVFPNGQQHAVLVATTDFLAREDIARRFFRAYAKAAEYYLKARQGSEPERTEVIRIVAGYTGMEPAVIDKVEWVDIAPDLKPDVEYMKQAQEWYFQNGYVDKKVNLDERVDLRYLPSFTRHNATDNATLR